MLWRISGVNFVHFGADKSVKNIMFRLWPLKVKGHFEFTSYLWLICQWLNNSEHFGAYCNLLSALEQKIWRFNWRKVRKKSWPMMTSKSDPRSHPGLKLCVHVSVMGCYRFTNFRQNRRGSGSKWHFFWVISHGSFVFIAVFIICIEGTSVRGSLHHLYCGYHRQGKFVLPVLRVPPSGGVFITCIVGTTVRGSLCQLYCGYHR